MKNWWTIKEVNYLKANYKKHSDVRAIATALNRPLGGVHQKISELGIAIPNKIHFSKEEIVYLQTHYKIKTNRELAAQLGKKITVVRMMMYSLGISRYSQKERAWTKQEDEILLNNYKVKGDTDIAKLLPGRTVGGVRKRRVTMKLKRTPKQVQSIIESNKPRFLQHSFKPGEKRYQNNMAKAWRTRKQSHEEVMKNIEKRMQRAA